ncbi:MAG: hypothetical protein HW400_407 [Candidatus Levybacteria bacterium]|nr:hypothetical protein [Candidatus Levybacteria bacterium]
MAEKQTEQFKEVACLPIKKESVKLTIKEIETDPHGMMLKENLILSKNLGLQTLIFAGIEAYATDKTQAMEAALFTHKFIRTQAELNSTSIPHITSEERDIYLNGFKRTLGLFLSNQGNSLTSFIEERVELMKKEDRQLGAGLREIFKYRAGRIPLHAGAISAYFPIRQIVQGIKLERKLGLKSE